MQKSVKDSNFRFGIKTTDQGQWIPNELLSKKSIFCQKVTVHKDRKIPFISNLKKPACASKQDMLKLTTLQYIP